VGNAIKHSNSPVDIRISSACVYEDGKKYCLVEVEDNGPGIPDSLKQQIFDRSGNERGIALPHSKCLGLYLVKTLVSDYHGRIWVEDRVPGDHTKGSRFVVLLPAL
jgi:signal transduction histidine kinase